jgi:ribose transport system permease protein
MKRILGLIIINLVLIGVFSLSTPHFLSKNNLIVLVDNMALEAIILSGYTLLLVGGNFDLSVDGVVALSGVTAGLMMTSGISWIIAAATSLLLAGLIGAFNGIIVNKYKINGLIATLTTWWICLGITFGTTKALAPYGFPDAFQLLGQTRVFGFRIIFVYAVILLIGLSIVLHFTKLGSHLYLSGDNKQASEMMGINVTRLGILMYSLVGVLAGFVGILLTSKLNAASPMAVDGMALRVIAAAVIGGANLSGGKGSIISGLLGLCLMGVLSNAIIQLGISPYWQKGLLGGVLLVAVLIRRNE